MVRYLKEEFNNAAATEMLLQHRAKVDAQDASGNTALLGVCFKGNDIIAKLLLDHGADINASNNSDSFFIDTVL